MKAWLANLPRDKADIVLLLLAAAMVLAPHALHLPPWLSTAVAALLLWRAVITMRGSRQPQLILLAPLALLGIAGVYASYGTVLGRDPGVAMLALLLALKSLEIHGRRDVQVLVFLGFCVYLSIASFRNRLSLLPVLGLLTNLYLMTQLGVSNWLLFFAWLVLGLGVYFGYGYKHSKLGMKNA